MQDRPTALELLAAVRTFIEQQVVPALEGGRQFHARVAGNVLAIVARELTDGDTQLRGEWARLTELCVPANGVPTSTAPPVDAAVLHAAVGALNAELAARIRGGDADSVPFRTAVLAHLRATADEKLRIANPAYLGEHR